MPLVSSRPRRLLHRWLAGPLLVASASSCVGEALALKVVDRLEASSVQRENDIETALRGLVQQSVSNLTQAMTRRIEAARQDLRARAYADTEKRIEKATEDAWDELEEELGPIVNDLQKQLNEARASGQRDREYEAAAQLGATLTVHARESLRLAELARERFRAVRDKHLATIEEKMNALLTDATVFPDSAQLVEAAMKTFADGAGGAQEYRAAVTEGYAELRRYIQDGNHAASFLAKGLLGEKLGAAVSGLMQKMGGEFTGTLETKLGDLVNGLTTKFGGELDLVKATGG